MHEIIAYGSFCACYLYYWAGAFEKLKDSVTTAYAQRKSNGKAKSSRDPFDRFIDMPPYDTGRITLSIFGMVRKASIVCVLVYVGAVLGTTASAPLLRIVPTVANTVPEVRSLVQGRGAQLMPPDADAAVAQLLSIVVTVSKEKAATDVHVQKLIGALAWVLVRAANIFVSFLTTSIIVYFISRVVVPNVKHIHTNGDLMYEYASAILFASGAAFLVILFILETSHDLKTHGA